MLEEADEVDERGQELNELRNYGVKLLEEMKYPKLIGMLQETMTHLHDIASEYAADAERWHSKYDTSVAQNTVLQENLQNISAVMQQQQSDMGMVIKRQSEQIKQMGQDFKSKLDALRSYRDTEIERYNERVQGLLAAQDSLRQMKEELSAKTEELAKAQQRYQDREKKAEEKQRMYERWYALNQEKIEAYDSLYNDKLKSEEKMKNFRKTADEQLDAVRKESADWRQQYEKERELRENSERECQRLRERPMTKYPSESPGIPEGNSKQTSSVTDEGNI